MATTIRILYWKEIPVQVEADDGSSRATRQLDSRFQEAADAIAMFDGSFGSDAYLDAWEWRGYSTSGEVPDAAVEQVVAKFNDGMPSNFLARIRDAHTAGTRDASPGAINHWLE